MELDALQDAHEEIQSLGGRLAAISPEQPSFAEDTRERHELTYPILFDEKNDVARRFGLVFRLGDEVNSIFREVLDVDLAEYNGNDSYELPIPATYVIAPDRSVVDAFVHADYTKRMEPDDIIGSLERI